MAIISKYSASIVMYRNILVNCFTTLWESEHRKKRNSFSVLLFDRYQRGRLGFFNLVSARLHCACVYLVVLSIDEILTFLS
jgi:hypothetical protein